RTLAVLHDVLADGTSQAFVELLEALATDEGPAQVGAAYGRLFALLADEAELSADRLVGDAWQNHLLDRLLETETPFSRKAQRTGAAGLGASLLAQTRRDLSALAALFSLDAGRLARAVAHAVDAESIEAFVAWDAFAPLPEHAVERASVQTPAARALKDRLAASSDWAPFAEELADHFARYGAGSFARFRAFRWVREGDHGQL